MEKSLMLTKGISLLECLIVLALLLVFLSATVPSGHQWLQQQRPLVLVEQIQQALNIGRYEAISRGVTVSYCASRDGERCSQDWSEGQLLFVDNNGSGQLDEGDEVLLRWPAVPGVLLVWRGFRSDQCLQIHPGGVGRAMNGTFTVSQALDGKWLANVIVSRTGRVRVET